MATDRKVPLSVTDDDLDLAQGGAGSTPIQGSVILQGRHLPSFSGSGGPTSFKDSTVDATADAENVTMNFEKVQIAYVPKG